MKYGYARASTTGQTLSTQISALESAGCETVFREKISGVASRKELERLLRSLGPGDVVVITRLDCLARSTRDLLNIVDRIVKAGAGFKSLGDAWADTTSVHGRPMLTVLAGIAEFERELIRQSTSEGRARARAEGKHLGRFPILTPHQQREAIMRLCEGETLRAIAKSLGVSHQTVRRLAMRANGTDLEILLQDAGTSEDAAALVSTFGH